jgi:outer membrane receptor for ferric coprogen and ferric-rhodotorulic acid
MGFVPTRKSGVRSWRAKFVCCALAVALALSVQRGAIAGDGDPPKVTLKIAPQPLGSALQELARQSGVQIVFFSRIADGLRAAGLDGEYSVTAALGHLLGGTQLTFQVLNPKTIQILSPQAVSPSAPAETRRVRPPPKPAQTQSTQDDVTTEEVLVTAPSEGLVATRTETPLREIPQSLSIISREQMLQQNDQDLGDALANAVGITATRNNSLNQQFYSRGFQITTLHLDGGAALNSADPAPTPFFWAPDLGEFDHIEVLRGSDALFGGNGNPGATINMVRKHPLSTPELTLDAWAGSWNNYRGEVDVTGPLALDGALRGRLDVVDARKNYFYDLASSAKKKVFAVFDYDITATTLLTVGGSYDWSDALPVIAGLPLFPDGSDPHLPRRTAYTFDWSRYRTRTREIYAQFAQLFGESWKLKVNATSLDAAAEFGIGEISAPIGPVTGRLPFPPGAIFTTRPNDQDQFALDITLTDTVHWFGRRVDLALGGDYTHFKANFDVALYESLGFPTSNAYHYDAALYPDPRTSPSSLLGPVDLATVANLGGLFASLKVYLTDAWVAVTGVRFSRDLTYYIEDVPSQTPGVTIRSATPARNPGKATPYAGLVYDLSPRYSLYASYADIYQTNAGMRGPDGSLLPAADGVTVETGVRASWREGALNGLLALYDIDQRGLAKATDLVPHGDPANILNCCYEPSGSNRSKGIDAELSGRLAPGWAIGSGYTYNVNKSKIGGAISSSTPRHLLKLWTNYDLAGPLRRWDVGGDLHVQTSNYTAGQQCNYNSLGFCVSPLVNFKDVQGFYTVVSLRLGYQIGSHWRAALSVNNVFDRVYFQTIGTSSGGNWYGEPRNFLVRIDGRY